METIEVTAAGPIEGTFEIDLSPGYGAYQLCGGQGAGKSTVLRTLDLLAGHKVDVTLHDGELVGHVKGWGVSVPIGSRKRRRGDLNLDTIDSEKFSPADVIDPPGQTAEVRDARRIKALASLAGADADPSLYYELVGGQKAFSELGLKDTTDPVVLVTRVKEKLDAVSREKQREAETEARHALPLETVPEGLDVSAPCDLESLGAQRDNCRDEWQRLQDARRNGLTREEEIQLAQAKLQDIQESYDGPSVTDAVAELKRTQDAMALARQATANLRSELAKAEEVERETGRLMDLAGAACDTAKQHETAIATLEETAKATVEYPDESTIAEAEAAVKAASEDYDTGVRVRDVRRNQASAKLHRANEQEALRQAAEAKNKAGEVFPILANSLDLKHISIEPLEGVPRLFVDHPARKRCLFDQQNGLSDGERVSWTLRELVPHLGSPGLLPVPQRVWQDLQPAVRLELHKLAVERELYVFGAQVDDGALRVEFLGA